MVGRQLGKDIPLFKGLTSLKWSIYLNEITCFHNCNRLPCKLCKISNLWLTGVYFVYRFNDDPSIDVLLLTTHVGGLGLNLTGADTVIFLEHDWNPMKDSQVQSLKMFDETKDWWIKRDTHLSDFVFIWATSQPG